MTESLFLTALSAAEKVGVGGTTVKFYNDFIKGRTDPFTEKDLTKEDLSGLKQLIKDNIAHQTNMKWDTSENRIGYGNYDFISKETVDPSLRNLLGQFTYDTDKNGNVTITDKYNFDKHFNANEGNSTFDMLKQAFTDPKKLAKGIAYRMEDQDGNKKSIPVKINLGKLD